MAIFFVLSLVFTDFAANVPKTRENTGVFGGPTGGTGANMPIAENQAALMATFPVAGHIARADIGAEGKGIIFNASLKDEQGSGPAANAGQGGILIYSVQKGDNLSKIAARFGISAETIIAANPKIKGRGLRLDEELTVLPVSGVVYTVRDGETLESIAASFNVSTRQIMEFNRGTDFSILAAGASLVIPGVKPLKQTASQNSLPNFNKYFIMPTEGFNWGKTHAYNAVDIANSCGTPVRAAAEGLVVPDSSFGAGATGWNNGYGHFVLVEHPFGNNVRTRYAHLDKTTVEIGDYVKQGQQIGTMGNTGNVHGPTGCHLHFEVYGAQNPFAK